MKFRFHRAFPIFGFKIDMQPFVPSVVIIIVMGEV